MTNDASHTGSAIASPMMDLVAPLSARMLFWRPRYLQDSTFLHHTPFVFWLVDVLRPRGCVTLGLETGVAHFAVCQAIDKLNIDARCYGIGTNPAQKTSEPITRYNDDQYSDFSKLLEGAPNLVSRRFPDQSVDLLIVDTQMTEDLLGSLQHEWVRKLSDRGVVVLHGMDTHLTAPPVLSFVKMITDTYPTVTFDAGDGLMVVLYGKQKAERLAQLAGLSLGTPGYSEVHHVFSRLGKAAYQDWESRAAVERASQAIAEAKAANENLRDTAEKYKALQDQMAAAPPAGLAKPETGPAEEDLRAKIEAHTKTIAALTTEKSGLTVRLDALGSQNSALQEKVKAQDEKFKGAGKSNEEIEKLKAAFSALETTAANKDARHTAEIRKLTQEKDTQISDLKDAVLKAHQETKDAKDALQEKHSQVENLENRLHHERTVLTAELEKAVDRVQEITTELGVKKVEANHWRAQNDTRFDELEKFTRAIDTDFVPRALFEQERAQIEEIRRSTSWKLTAPARKLISAARPGRK